MQGPAVGAALLLVGAVTGGTLLLVGAASTGTGQEVGGEGAQGGQGAAAVDGELLWQRDCVSCHGARGEGGAAAWIIGIVGLLLVARWIGRRAVDPEEPDAGAVGRAAAGGSRRRPRRSPG